MISDESLASLTSRIGAQAIVTGSLDDATTEYRFRVRVIGTETTAALASYSGSVNINDRRIAAFADRAAKTAGENITTGVLNIVLGLGSYIEGDTMGGLTISLGFTAAAGLMLVEAFLLDWDNPAVGVPGTIGFGVAGVALVYGFVRPFIYNRPPKTAFLIDNTKLGIVQTSDTYTGSNNFGLQLLYSINF
jgi:hypothetical protein